MCAIAGILSANKRNLSRIFAMTSVQAHRGPDGDGHVFFEMGDHAAAQVITSPTAKQPLGRLALGHRRLSIIDVNERSAQPMSYANGKCWITYNGELYNFVELRRELTDLGHSFRTESDTEVILASYVQWGLNCFDRFNGMWALAIWDDTSKSLILSRDRFGIKPLHFSIENGTLWFSSEIKGILASQEVSARANPRILYDYLVHGLVNTRRDTFFSSIGAFPPGCYAVVNPEVLSVTPTRYWTLTPKKTQNANTSFEEACHQFKEMLSSAVRLQMRSDVPVGACLSGGLDSSSIVSLMAGITKGSVYSFTAGFDDIRFDETRWARLVVNALRLHGSVVNPTEQGLINDFERLVWHQEEPFTTASLYAQWKVISQARDSGVKVLLDGQGADEILAGYLKFYAFYILLLARQRRYFSSARELMNLIVNGDRGYFNVQNVARYFPRSLHGRPPQVQKYFRPGFITQRGEDRVKLDANNTIAERQILDIDQLSLPSLLRYEDRNSMAWSIESRVPFLDHRLVEFLINLPNHYKFRKGRTKELIRSGMRGIVPDEVLNRRDKMGFITPQSEWMKSKLGEFIESRCRASAATLNRWIDIEAVLTDWRQAATTGHSADQSLVFRLGVLAQWIETYQVESQ
jgi:asparagine synthase (glutamine-hydrolysing)